MFDLPVWFACNKMNEQMKVACYALWHISVPLTQWVRQAQTESLGKTMYIYMYNILPSRQLVWWTWSLRGHVTWCHPSFSLTRLASQMKSFLFVFQRSVGLSMALVIVGRLGNRETPQSHPTTETSISRHWDGDSLFQRRELNSPHSLYWSIRCQTSIEQQRPLSFFCPTDQAVSNLKRFFDRLSCTPQPHIYANAVRPPWKPQAVLLKMSFMYLEGETGDVI